MLHRVKGLGTISQVYSIRSYIKMNKNLISVALAGIFAFSANIASAEDMFSGAWYVLPGASYMNTEVASVFRVIL